jgi:hypothetical protein
MSRQDINILIADFVSAGGDLIRFTSQTASGNRLYHFIRAR